jgi:hypothetical protein
VRPERPLNDILDQADFWSAYAARQLGQTTPTDLKGRKL